VKYFNERMRILEKLEIETGLNLQKEKEKLRVQYPSFNDDGPAKYRYGNDHPDMEYMSKYKSYASEANHKSVDYDTKDYSDYQYDDYDQNYDRKNSNVEEKAKVGKKKSENREAEPTQKKVQKNEVSNKQLFEQDSEKAAVMKKDKSNEEIPRRYY